MAVSGELLISVGHGHCEDGDVVCAFNTRVIRACHMMHICHHSLVGFTDGLRPDGSLLETMLENTCQYKFERISTEEVRRTDLVASKSEVFSDVPNGNDERINVESFLEHRFDSPNHKIFGSHGSEVWYGGKTDYSHANLDIVWAVIEVETSNREVDFPRWPLGNQEAKMFLPIAVDDFDDSVRSELMAPLLDPLSITDPPEQLKKRKSYVEWRSLAGISLGDQTSILDPTQNTDKRELSTYTRASIVQTKVA